MNRDIIKVKEPLFYFGLILQLIYTAKIITINSYTYSSIYILFICLSLFCVILMNSYTKKELLSLFIFLSISMGHYLISKDTNLLRIFFLIFAAKEIDINRFKKFLFISYIVLFVGVIFASIFLDFNTIYQKQVWRTNVGEEIRYNFGFDGPIRISVIWVLCMISTLIYFNKRHISFKITSFFAIVTIIIFMLTDSYTGLLLGLILIFMIYFFQIAEKYINFSIIKIVIIISLIFVLTITFASTYLDLSSTFFAKFMHGRVELLKNIPDCNLITLLFGGVDLSGYVGLDNSYYYNLFNLGLLFMIFMIISIIKLSIVLDEKKDITLAAISITLIFMAYVTQFFEYIFLNYFLFIFIIYWKDIMVCKDTPDAYRYSLIDWRRNHDS